MQTNHQNPVDRTGSCSPRSCCWPRAAARPRAAAQSASASATSTSSSSSSAGPSTSSAAAASSGPGVGKPPVTIGDKNFTEEYILGALYQQALAAKGYKVTLKGNIGSSEIIWKAATGGQIQMYPEYTGTYLTAICNDNKPPTSAKQTYDLAKACAAKQGFTLLGQTPFYDSDALAATKAYAAEPRPEVDRRPQEARQVGQARRRA